MKNLRIGVVMGGPSAEREVSLNTGRAIMQALKEKGYIVVDIDLDPSCFIDDIRQAKVDIIVNAIHGKYGEDGILQGALDLLGIPYTGSGLLASALTMDKVMTKRIFLAEGLSTPRSSIFGKQDGVSNIAAIIRQEYGLPVVIKPSTQGSSIGVTIVKTDENLLPAIDSALKYSEQILVEEFIGGKELTVAILGTEIPQALPIIEIVPHSGCYDYHSKYTKGATEYIVPAVLTDAVKAEIQDIALRAYKIFDCCGVARIDFMLDNNNIPYILEVNTIPGMTATSLVPKAAAAAGISFADLCEKLLHMAVNRSDSNV